MKERRKKRRKERAKWQETEGAEKRMGEERRGGESISLVQSKALNVKM